MIFININILIVQIQDIFVNRGKISKPAGEIITIGRGSNNDIPIDYPFVSRNHGKIFLESGVFQTHLDYEDMSKRGTVIIRWDGPNVKSELVKKKSVKIKPDDWILLCSSGRTGILLIPYVS